MRGGLRRRGRSGVGFGRPYPSAVWARRAWGQRREGSGLIAVAAGGRGLEPRAALLGSRSR